MLTLAATTSKLQVVTSAAGTLAVHASFMDASTADPPVVKGSTSSSQNTAISSATTTDVVAAPGASTLRNVKFLSIRNANGATATDVTVLFNANGTTYELFKANLDSGEQLTFTEGIGWYEYPAAAKLDRVLRVPTDSVHATAATFAAITGLSQTVESGKHYLIQAELIHISNATTTGAQFAFGGVAMTGMIASTIDTVTASVTASTHSAGTVAAVDTAITAQTTGSAGQTLAHITGWINPSASGTFSIKATSEVTVAAGLTVKAGSWLWIREFDG